MQLSKSFLQSFWILVILAQQPEGKPLKSAILSKRIGASNSYLIKIANKLKRNGLIDASASKLGGYYLKKPINKISYLNVYDAIESQRILEKSNLHLLIDSKDVFKNGFKKFQNTINASEDNFRIILANHFLDEIVPKDDSGNIIIFDRSNN